MLRFSCVSDIEECASNPCVNDATCVDNVNGYTCDCAAGYTGTHCEQGGNCFIVTTNKIVCNKCFKVDTYAVSYNTVYLGFCVF